MTTNNTITKNVVTDLSAADIYIEKVLEKWVKRINELGIVDDHNGRPTSIDGLVLLASGYVCPTFNNRSRYWSLNELYMGNDGKVHISMASVAGTMKRYDCLDKSVYRYNEMYYAHKNEDIFDVFAGMLIIGYYEF